MSSSAKHFTPDIALLELFAADLRAAVAAISEGLPAVKGAELDRTHLEQLTRAAHSLKGAARIVQLDSIANLAEQLETTFTRADETSKPLSEGLSAKVSDAAVVLATMSEMKPAEFARFAEVQVARIESSTAALKNEEGGDHEPASKRRPSRRPPPPEASPVASLTPALDPGLFAMFRAEAEGCVTILNKGIVELESGDTRQLEELMRAAHSIKGASRIVGASLATGVAHALEECLVAVQRGELQIAGERVDTLLTATDVLAEIARCTPADLANWTKSRQESVNAVVASLNAMASGQIEQIVAVRHSKIPIFSPPLISKLTAPPKISSPPKVSLSPKGAAAAPAVEARKVPQENRERVVRVAASSINRLMGLAGESLVESRRVQAMGSAMQRLKRRQAELADVLDALSRQNLDVDGRLSAIVADAKARALECRNLLSEQMSELDAYSRRVDDLSDRMYREALKSRMRPFGDGVRGLPRMVRDVARQLGKRVKLEIIGEATDVDRDVAESLEAPLNHLLRNSVDHGIETPQERLALGKPEHGTIRLEARHRAGMLSITVSDDGRGIDLDALRTKIVEKWLLNANMARTLSPAETLEFIFLPGFSTARNVTEISGRGVGLDAARTAVEAASGTLRVTTEQKRGTTFHLQLPVTRSVLRAVVTEVANEAYAFPLLKIERVMRIPSAEVKTLSNTQYFVLDGANIALVGAQQLLGVTERERSTDEICVVVIGDRAHRYGLAVDKFLGEHDLVVRPLDSRLGKVQDIAAAAILMDGSAALIFDVDDLIRSIEKLASAGRIDRLAGRIGAASPRQRKRILVVDDSVTVREAERQLLVNRGYEVDVAVDGMDGLNSVRASSYDLVISDIDMPRMNGLELVRTIKQDPALTNIPVVIVSYKDRQEDRMRGLDAGASYYLAKSSFHDETLVHAVEELIGSAEA